jgi:protein-S-isoprenylcysteine O-methyltransferase Ste14
MSSKFLEYRPPRIAMTLLIVAGLLHVLTPLQSVRVYSSIIVAGVLGSLGFAVMMWAWWQFQQHQVAICPTEKTDHLITGGIYRFTRNPMYLGMIMMLLGVAVFFGTLPFYVVTIGYFAIIDRSFCPYEEDKLSASFGPDYETYAARVRRWI